MKKHFLSKTYKVFCLNEFTKGNQLGRIVWRRELSGDNYPGDNCPAIELEHEISFSLVNRSSSRFSVLKFSLDLPFQNK